METKNSVEHPSSNSPKPLLLDQYPKKNFWDFSDIFQSQGFWYTNPHLEAARDILAHFEAHNDDNMAQSPLFFDHPWSENVDVKVDEEEEEEEDDPLVKNTPSSCVQTIENQVYMTNPTPDLSGMPSPRLFHTHFPYSALPDSIKNSKCKIVYVTRNPKDTMVSMWHFFNSVRTPEQGPYPFDKAFESFCDGLYPFRPFFNHVLEYSEASLKKSDKILFWLHFSEGHLLKNLEVNKNGSTAVGLPTNSFYRLGVVGDWKNNFSPEMEERLDQISSMKLEKTGLDLNK
ncbi:unnamed protein product [Camellia sinensis]